MTKEIHSVPLIFEGSADKKIPDDFNTVSVSLDATLDSDLHWEKQKVFAFEKSKEGYRFFWDLHLGLFHALPLSISDTSQYKSLQLALEHFFEHFWKEFSEKTVGACLYKGPLDMTAHWPFDADQILNLRDWLVDHFKDADAFTRITGLPCSDLLSVTPGLLASCETGKNILRFYCLGVAVDYFDILASSFPPELEPYVLFDASGISSETHRFQLLNHEDLEFLNPGIKGSSIRHHLHMGWQDQRTCKGYIGSHLKPYSPSLVTPVRGIMIPERLLFRPDELHLFDDLLEKLERRESVKLLSEKKLSMEWEGLEDLFVLKLEENTKRKVEGFIAAGGRAVTPNGNFGFSHEISFSTFFKEQVV